jgi:uncharacterized protein (DUF2147 family)
MAVAVASATTANAQGPAAPNKPAAPAKVDPGTLKGNWVRPDGGYRIEIKGVAANGELDATYYNPNRLPFAKAQATLEGATLRANFELQAGGYNGSTYDLTYDPASDRLKGIYYQAVVKQKFEVFFTRK